MNLILVCLIAFVMVIVILSVLAAAMTGITRLFPPPTPRREGEIDAAVVAAIQAAAALHFQGARVMHIEEKPSS